jgi:hypothetical protein
VFDLDASAHSAAAQLNLAAVPVVSAKGRGDTPELGSDCHRTPAPTGRRQTERTTMSKLSAKIKDEILTLLPPTIFFFVALHIVSFVRVLMLKGTGIAPGTSVSVGLAALILGKAVLIADNLPFINRYPTKPLIYNVVWKTVIYTLVALLIHYLEQLVDFWRQTGGLAAGNRKLLAEIVWPHFLSIQILLVVMVLSYCAIRELARVVGRDRLIEMFFGIRPRARASPFDR